MDNAIPHTMSRCWFLIVNDDVFQEIICLLNLRDTYHLSRTCRAAYTVALPRLLSEILVAPAYIARRSGECRWMDPPTFCSYMLYEPSRVLFLRRLTLASANAISNETTVRLHGVLAQASELTHLTVGAGEPASGRDVFNTLESAMQSLVSLRSISLESEDPQIFLLLSHLAPSVHSIQLRFRSANESLPIDWGTFIGNSLSDQSALLRSLEIGGKMQNALQAICAQRTKYPHVQRLLLCDDTEINRVSHLFPTVQKLVIESVASGGISGLLTHANNSSRQTPLKWMRLDSLDVGGGRSFSCPTRALRAEVGIDRIQQVVAVAKPSVLFWKASEAFYSIQPLDALSPQAAATLQYVELDFTGARTDRVPYHEMLRVAATLKLLSLAAVAIRYYMLPTGMRRQADFQSHTPYTMHADALAAAVAETIPSVLFVGVADDLSPTEDTLQWHQVTAREEGRTPDTKALAAGDGRIIEEILTMMD